MKSNGLAQNKVFIETYGWPVGALFEDFGGVFRENLPLILRDTALVDM